MKLLHRINSNKCVIFSPEGVEKRNGICYNGDEI